MRVIVFLNGQFLPEEEAMISVFDRGFLYGDGIFETLRVNNGKPFLLDRHIGRLQHGMGTLHIGERYNFGQLLQHATAVIAKNNCKNAVLRIHVTRGPGKRGYSPSGNFEPTVLMSIHEAPSIDPNTARPRKIITATQVLSDHDPMSTVKTTNKLPYILAKREAEVAGADDALLTNREGNVSEATSSNLFWINNSEIITTPLQSGCISGITRGMVLELAAAIGVPTHQLNAEPRDLYAVDGLFLTNSVSEIQTVNSLDGHDIAVSPLIHQLHLAYHEVIAAQ
jgi:aminodeoxychorismate lyase